MKSIGIIGGGSSGLVAAIGVIKSGNRVTVFEKNDRVGKKILQTGNGKCNFTNRELGADKYYTDDPDFVSSVLSRFSFDDCVAFFKGLGMLIKDKNGYLYPASEQASTVLDLLRNSVVDTKGEIITDCLVKDIKPGKTGYTVVTDKGNYDFDKVIVSTGGLASIGDITKYNMYDVLRSLGHTVKELYPSLVKYKCKGINFPALKGVRQDAIISVYEGDNFVNKANGELLFYEEGISGIVTFQLSHCITDIITNNQRAVVSIDLLPGVDREELNSFLKYKAITNPDCDIQTLMIGILNKKLNVEIIKLAGFNPSMPVKGLNDDDYNNLSSLLKALKLTCKETAGYEFAQVTMGGIPLNEVTDDLESVICPGLYITGELLDVDGICGGYNLHWAFATGHIAGEKACF